MSMNILTVIHRNDMATCIFIEKLFFTMRFEEDGLLAPLRLPPFRLILYIPQPPVQPVFRNQLLMPAALNNVPVFDDQNLTGVAEVCQLVGNHNHRFVFQKLLQSRLNQHSLKCNS